MADVFDSPELAGVVYPKSFQHAQLHHLHPKDGSPRSQSAESLNEGEPELESDAEEPLLSAAGAALIDPEPYVSAQFYTFNSGSHHLMVQCIMQNRYASPREIREATPPSVLQSWRGVWKDRNEDTAYLTGWKRIQDKLHARIDAEGHELLFFKNSPQQFIPHINQWQEIILGFHGDADLQHLGVKDTIERIKQVWTVGAKLYGIPESYIKVCVASCPVCCSSERAHPKQSSKRRRFEYTESFEVQAKEVPQRLQQLAAKYQVVLCIRQKYIRFKPFLAEVKDYCCHRAGEPSLKKPGVLKRKRYSSKRCGCGFRIRAIVPITNYSEKEKTFSYQEEGQAIFKLYAVHSGHEPGPHEGSARIMHRLVGSSGVHSEVINPVVQDQEFVAMHYVKDELEARGVIMHQVHELCLELQMLDGKLGSLSREALNNLWQDLMAMTHKIKHIEEFQETHAMLISKNNGNDLIMHHPELAGWACEQSRNKEEGIVDDHIDPDFDSALGPDTHWARENSGLATGGRAGSLKDSCPHYDCNGISAAANSETCNPEGQQAVSLTDTTLVSIPVRDFYQENVKWYEGVPCGLDESSDDLQHSVGARF